MLSEHRFTSVRYSTFIDELSDRGCVATNLLVADNDAPAL
jgi:hypothetical protein